MSVLAVDWALRWQYRVPVLPIVLIEVNLVFFLFGEVVGAFSACLRQHETATATHNDNDDDNDADYDVQLAGCLA